MVHESKKLALFPAFWLVRSEIFSKMSQTKIKRFFNLRFKTPKSGTKNAISKRNCIRLDGEDHIIFFCKAEMNSF